MNPPVWARFSGSGLLVQVSDSACRGTRCTVQPDGRAHARHKTYWPRQAAGPSSRCKTGGFYTTRPRHVHPNFRVGTLIVHHRRSLPGRRRPIAGPVWFTLSAARRREFSTPPRWLIPYRHGCIRPNVGHRATQGPRGCNGRQPRPVVSQEAFPQSHGERGMALQPRSDGPRARTTMRIRRHFVAPTDASAPDFAGPVALPLRQ
jgi:hypothetical protein